MSDYNTNGEFGEDFGMQADFGDVVPDQEYSIDAQNLNMLDKMLLSSGKGDNQRLESDQ